MRFKITANSAHNNLTELIYDNDTGVLLDPSGHSFGGFSERKETLSPNEVKITELTVVLGLNCNLSCSYCIQRDYANRGYNISFTKDKIDPFIEKLKQYPWHKTITRVCLWGGEPLVYWKTIQALVPRLIQTLPALENFYMSTNATLLDKEKLDFCYTNRIIVQISDDGDNFNRGESVEKSIVNVRTLVKDFKKSHPDMVFNVHSTLTRDNPDAHQMITNLVNAYGDSCRFIIVPAYLPLNSKDYSWYTFTPSALRVLEDSVYRAVSEFNLRSLEALEKKARAFFNPPNDKEYTCHFAFGKSICMNCDGEFYSCRENPYPENRYEYADRFSAIKRFFTKKEEKIGCTLCPFRNICGGFCSALNGQRTNEMCGAFYAFNRGLIRGFFKKCFKAELIKIETENRFESSLLSPLDKAEEKEYNGKVFRIVEEKDND